MTDVVLETGRLVLRRERDGDFAVWMAHLNTPEVRAYLGGVNSAEDAAENVAKMARGWEANGFSFMFVDLKPAGPMIGICGLSRIETECAPEELRGAIQVGWILRADHWGKGYAAEAARAVLAWAFDDLGIETVYSQTSQRNRASWGLMEKLGLSRRADLDYGDPKYPPEDNPTIVYAIGRDEWAARAEA